VVSPSMAATVEAMHIMQGFRLRSFHVRAHLLVMLGHHRLGNRVAQLIGCLMAVST
jgi:hypothetical protein